ncbi:hypothetical protein [uncultured Corynebacterium sp.]|uniref:hypothetical protein n=1 Tax=uncultured Corynebacterium sp. TaxID=159447 RepID=UPI002620EAAC|nr:hypothetical protein [uncultured Corynebacterium sp.]
MDSSKFAVEGMHFVARLSTFDDIVIDQHTTPEQNRLLEQSGARIHVVETQQPELPTASS